MPESRTHGVKRKREIAPKEKNVQEKLRSKLHHGVKEVKKVSKKVKTFETQKLVKKLKDARKQESNEVQTLEKQLAILKLIDHEEIGTKSLQSKIKKDVFLSKNDDCQTAIALELQVSARDSKAESSTARTVVESRLLSSKLLAQETTTIIKSLKVLLGAEEETRVGNKVVDDDGDEFSEDQKLVTGSSEDEDGDEEDENEDRGVSEDRNDGLDWQGFSSGDGGEGGEESDGVVNGRGSSNSISKDGLDAGSSEGDEEDSEGIQSDSSSQIPTSSKKPRTNLVSQEDITKGNKKARTGESTFLPSLSVGFVDGDSDAEWSDAEANIADAPVKKNRRGQRARQAIWEKKFGRNANHVKKRTEADVTATIESAYAQRGSRGRGRGRGESFRTGAPAIGAHAKREGEASSSNSHSVRFSRSEGQATSVHGNSRARGRGAGFERSSNRHDATYGGESNHNNNKKERKGDVGLSHVDDKPLHPSWEAKRRLKEKESPAIISSQGTRLTFT